MRIVPMSLVGAAMIAIASPIAAQQTRTVQQDFEAATALADKGDDAGALAAWQALEKRVPPKNRRSLAIVHVRMGAALYKLDRMDDAVAAVRAGLVDLPASDATLNGYRYDAYFQLGQIAESGLDYASAMEAYRLAESAAPLPVNRLAALRGLVASETFLDPERGATDLARAEAILATLSSDAKSKAIFAMLKSVLMLNLGKYPEARIAAGDAVKLLGGLTDRIDLHDVAARSDYALAALLEGRIDDARRYMAMTGAGRLPKGSFDPGVQMKAPYCGGEAGLKPDDVAVIEFSIGDDGSVISSIPIYAAGGGNAALAFARAARNWSWTPEQVKQLPEFFRYRARVELRCSTAFQRPSIYDYLGGKLDSWLLEKHVELQQATTDADAMALPGLRSRLVAAEAAKGRDSLALVPLLYAMMTNSVVGREESNALAKRALAIADANGVPPTARLALIRVIWTTERADYWRPGALARAMAPALEDPVFARDPEARAAIRLIMADASRSRDSERTRKLLSDVSDDPALAPNHPLRVGALIRTASIEAADGKVDAAKTAFDSSGLSAQQCAIVDSAPRMLRSNSGSGNFPLEALRWGFEGWTQVQFDISADGKVLNQRAIIAYPPFVFTKAGSNLIANARFEKSYRPDGGLGCGGSTSGVRFILPH
ncbi:MAG: hypothetical protein JWN66_1947 [Sphingomonas bacterium]|uniref:hypothetical protein n=1 Tax=Sphingomonas bacterium TaxID=1895847 RepID=UPI00262DE5FF|nr:hypothetical protein [Sphingomonas bacterium]MDB5704831.1 hypothetical protein [Sphingomonas bacterium]